MKIRSLLLSLPLLVACSDAGSSNPKGGATLGLAVVNSDFKSTSISLVDPKTGQLAQDDCVNSGSASPVLSMALSGDVGLASQTQPADELLLIDRTNGALVWLDPTRCAVKRQAAVGTGFYANPHDVVAVSSRKAYVTRYDKNQTPGAQAHDGGDDVLVIDPSAGTITGRIDLSGYATAAGVQARPDRMILAGGIVYVSLNNQAGDFMSAGSGRVVAIDPATDRVVGSLELGAVKNCSGLDYVASRDRLLVSCGGDFNSADQAGESGVAVIEPNGGEMKLEKLVRASVVGGRPFAGTVSAVSDKLAIATTHGDFSGTPPDALWVIDLDTEASTKIAEGDASFVLGGVSADVSQQRLYVTSASMTRPRVLVFDTGKGTAMPKLTEFESNPRSGLPPRQIAWY